MATIEKLLESQEETGETIQRIIRNFKKDSPDRKVTTKYFEERLLQLQLSWDEFQATDSEIRNVYNDDPLKLDYFSTGYYDNISTIALNHIKVFENEVKRLRSQPGATPKETHDPTINKGDQRNPSDNPPPTTAQAINAHDGLISRSRGKMAALTRQLEGLHLQPGQEGPYYDVKRTTITQLWQQLERLNDEVLDKYPNPDIAGYDSRRYIQLEEASQLAIIQLTSANRSHPQPTTEPTAKPSTLPLPTITIPKFEGDYMKWISFADLFTKTVHEQQMSDAHKMWYLKTNVIGEAANLINHLAVTAENYSAAWQLLKDRYDNKRVMVATAVQRLLDQPSGASTLGAIKRLHDTTKECLAALSNMGLQTASWDPLLIHILVKRVDKTVHTQYEQSIAKPKELQTVSQFLTFLENHFHTLEAMGHKEKHFPFTSKTCTLTAQPRHDAQRCIACRQDSHPLYRCKEFIRLSPTNRLNLAQRYKLCVNCLNNTHMTKQCTTSGRCQKCGKGHHTLVHLEPSPQNKLTSRKHIKTAKETVAMTNSSPQNATFPPSTPLEEVKSMALSSVNQGSYVLLGTALVKVRANGLEAECKAILDSGSQVNLITEGLVHRLGLPARATSISINGIGTNRTKVQHRVNINLQSRLNKFSTHLEAFVLPQIISPQPAQPFTIDKWSIPSNVVLADPTFNRPEKIDILLGAEFYHQLLTIGQIKLADDLPLLQNTTLGWIVSGKLSGEQLSSAICGVLTEEDKMNTAIERFWELEEVEGKQQQLSPYDAQCEAHFNQHTTRDDEGRFIVRLPFCAETSLLGSSHNIAFNRFLALERRLSKDASLKIQYEQFMKDYETMGHMSKINVDEVKGHKYFIPHHSVVRPESSTTKLRVVFDASAKTSSGKSLNDILHTGPILQNNLFTILLRFRLPRFVFTTDIEKMYRQILIHPEDRQYQIILWRHTASEPINYFQLNTVTYGTRPAPYLAIKCLKEISQENKTQFPLAASFLERHFYVDDGLGGADSLSIALETQRQLQQVMAKYGFYLRKWCANHTQLLRNIPNDDQEVSLDFSTDKTDYTKTLGLVWLPKDDLLKIKVNIQPIKTVTKRTVTSDLARIFDPLGILSPVVVKAKMFIQELWTLNLSWDEAVPLEFDSRWRSFRSNLKELESYHTHRHIFKGAIPDKTQLHVFTDASEKAYGAAIYVRTCLPNKTIIIYLLCAKSRIAPLKQQTLPRLELCAAQLGANLAAKVKLDLDMSTTPTFYWSDSKIVLSWINSRSSAFHTFVANRIASIQETSAPQNWRHVSSKENPADIISRGLDPQQLQHTPQWMYGPFFLHGDKTHWPPNFCLDPNMPITEQKQNPYNSLVAVSSENFLHSINHRNSLKTLQGIMGYILRFIKNLKTTKAERQLQRALTPFELHDALAIIVRVTQHHTFKEDIHQLHRQRDLKGSSQIKSLSPFLDEHNLLRVGGRLEASTLSFNAKHPLLLPYNDIVTKLIFAHTHKENKHCGPNALLATIRQRFWPIKGKQLARETVHKCIQCARSKPKLLQQIMGNLPETRVTPARPFINAGVDYCGPIWVHFKTRGKRPQKAYIAVFCCFSTKAVHLELVTDLTTDAFIGALKRFISRRGHCQNLYSDNATNFVGARNQLAELSTVLFATAAQDKIQEECATKGISFHFIPPRAPHFGGLWEAAVKSAKRLLVKEVTNASLTYEEMETVIIEVEAILNSRPIAPLPSSPNDEAALTPGHFLIGEPLTAQVDATAQSTSTTLAKRWELVSQIKHQFWKRWSQEYLNELQQRNKWQTKAQNLQLGTIVIIKDNTPVMTWRLGKVVETYPGPDGIVRTAAVKTSSGVIKRAIHLLAPLPVEPAITTAANEETEQQQRKRSNSPTVKTKCAPPLKRCILSTASMLMFVALLCPLILCQQVTYTQITSNPGLHFENIGQVKPIIAEWKLLIYFELNPFYKEVQLLNNGTSTLKEACKDPSLKHQCDGLIAHFQKLNEQMETGLANLAGRKKRGAIDVVGNIASSLFGVLDSKYAEKMTDTINSIKTNEAHLRGLLRNQTSFLDSTLNLMKQSENQTQANFEKINLKISKLMALANNAIDYRSQVILPLSVQLLAIADNLQKMHASMINLIADTYHGRISPVLLTPQQFSTEINTIKANLPPDIALPVSDIIHLYGVVTAHAAISAQHLICTLLIPLTHQNKYDLFYITPVPQPINNSLVTVIPAAKMIALNAHRDEYFPVDDIKLLACSKLEQNTFLCPNTQATYYKGSPICHCEIHLFNNESDPTCNIELISSNHVWYQLYNRNQWLLATKRQLKVSTVCKGESHYQVLEGTGLLTLPAGCQLKTDVINIYGHQTIISSVYPSYISSGMSFHHLLENVNKLTQPLPYRSTIENITQLQAEVKAQLQDLPQTTINQQVHSLSISYVGLALIIIVIVILSTKRLLNRRLQKGTEAPQPAPRSTWNISVEPTP